MGIIYNRWTATCLLEFQAAYRGRDLPWSIFTFQLQLNRHDKHIAKGQPRPRFIFILSPHRPDGLDLMQKFLTWWQKAPSGRERRRERHWTEWVRKWGSDGEWEGDGSGGMVRAGVCIWAFRWVSIIQGKRVGSWPLKSIHGKGVFTVNINISVCAMAGATFDKPTAVNYELACRVGDRLVNMQSWRSAEPVQHKCQTPTAPGVAGVDLRVNHLHWPSNRTGIAWNRPKNSSLTHTEINFFIWRYCKKVTRSNKTSMHLKSSGKIFVQFPE